MRNGKSFSDVLRSLADAADPGERISFGTLLDALHDRAFGALMLVFAAPNVIPIPIPGISTLLSAPLLYLAAQLMLGHDRPWLPRWIAERSISALDFEAMVDRILPWVIKAERMLKPRLDLLTNPAAERLIGAICLGLAIILFFPIPLGNMLPGLAISLLALGILEKDGVFVAVGSVLAVLSVVIVFGVLVAIAKAIIFLIAQALGL